MILTSSHWTRSAKIFEYVFSKELKECSWRSSWRSSTSVKLQTWSVELSWKIELLCRYFLIGFSTVAEPSFCRIPPSGRLYAVLGRKRMKEMSFGYTQSDIILCGIVRFSLVNKNRLRTFQSQKWKIIKNSQPQTKFSGSYIKKRV